MSRVPGQPADEGDPKEPGYDPSERVNPGDEEQNEQTGQEGHGRGGEHGQRGGGGKGGGKDKPSARGGINPVQHSE